MTVSNARISIDNNTGTLTISNIQRSDRGWYIIRVMNKYGIDSADYDLTVYCKFVYILNVYGYIGPAIANSSLITSISQEFFCKNSGSVSLQNSRIYI